ncbi:LPS-assembly protein LptD precursor [mine drainage metagenome]|uniref:LPS-assembly protein LptD n=1 Tax=mine drainage metagenome TaxID=410659 RepID=A0A1J5SSJ6_9ZZZZ
MLKSRLITGVTAILLMCSLRSQAQDEAVSSGDVGNDESITIEGNKLEMHLDRDMRAIGNASISRNKQTILGDEIDYDVQNDQLHVVGNTQIELGGATLTGPELRMRLSESLGEMRDASIAIKQSKQPSLPISNDQQDGFVSNAEPPRVLPQSRGDAKTILFEGQDKKRLLDARYTTCAAGVDDWYIKAKELKLNQFTEAGVAKHAYVEFKGVPLLYTPWLSFSYGNQRKSGLLAPSYGTTTTSGLELTVPYYWNIAPNMDATLAMRELSKRGVQLQGEYRYLEDTFSGMDSLEYLPNDSLTGSTRYYANLKHQQNLGRGWSAGYSFEKVSDDQYFSELSTRITSTSRILLPQQFNVDYADATWSFNAIAQKFQTLDKASYPYERLPQMTLNGHQSYGPANVNLYTQLVAFGTDKSNVNAATLATGTRATIYPSISIPFYRPYGYVTPKVGIHSTSYSLNNDPNGLGNQQRTVPIFSLDSGLYFDRDFKIANRAYSQTLEPRLFYTYIPNVDQSKIPVFDTGLLDLNFSSLFAENQFVGNDRINDANQVSLALTTRLIESDVGTQRLSASIGQRYYFADQKVALDYTNAAAFRKSNSSDIIAGFSANLKTSWRVDAFWQYNTHDASSVRSTFTSRYNPEPGKVLNLSYSNRSDSTIATQSANINQFNISGQWPLSRGWYGVGRANYSISEKHVIETLAGVEYNAGCWQTRTVIQRVSTPTAQANYALFFQLELGGLASIGSNPMSLIKRTIPGYVKSGNIPDSYQQPYDE